MLFTTLFIVATTSTLITAAPAPVPQSPDSASTTPAPSLPSITGSPPPTTGSLGLPPNSINSTDPITALQAASQPTGLPTIPITIINNTVAALQAAATGLPTIPITIINNTVAAAQAAGTGLPTIPISIVNNTVAAAQATGTGLPTIPISIVNSTVAAALSTDLPTSISSSFPVTITPTDIPRKQRDLTLSIRPTDILTSGQVVERREESEKRNAVLFPLCDGQSGPASTSLTADSSVAVESVNSELL